ncbi:MAG: aldo/keto reductase [Bacteriovoracaceae bacterium]
MKPFLVKTIQKTIFPIGFGGASLSGEGGGYGFGEMSEDQAQTLIRGSLERGINLFDTAPIYGFGLSELRLGKYLKQSDEAFIVSKGGVDWHDTRRVNMSNDPKIISKMLHESLNRLQRDCIDLYMIHWPDPKIDIRKPMEVLYRAQEAGKIRYIGLANTNDEDLTKAQEITEVIGFQAEHNLWTTKNYELVEPLLDEQLFMGWGTFDKGILSGRVTEERKFDSSDARSWAPWWSRKEVALKLAKIDKLKSLLNFHRLELASFSLGYALSTRKPVCSLIGFKSIEDLDKILTSLNNNISHDFIHKIYDDWINLSS